MPSGTTKKVAESTQRTSWGLQLERDTADAERRTHLKKVLQVPLQPFDPRLVLHFKGFASAHKLAATKRSGRDLVHCPRLQTDQHSEVWPLSRTACGDNPVNAQRHWALGSGREPSQAFERGDRSCGPTGTRRVSERPTPSRRMRAPPSERAAASTDDGCAG